MASKWEDDFDFDEAPAKKKTNPNNSKKKFEPDN